MTYAIMVRERGAKKETELCRVESNPEKVKKAAQEKTLLIDLGTGNGRKVRVNKYEHVHVVEIK